MYVSEADVPMYRLGYDDGTGGAEGNEKDKVREFYRVCGGDVKASGGGFERYEEGALRGMRMCRFVCDACLEAALDVKLEKRPGSGVRGWAAKGGGGVRASGEKNAKAVRKGDYSILYGMNYFNSPEALKHAVEDGLRGESDGRLLNLKEHVDPSLFVLEPIRGRGGGGLEVWDELLGRFVNVEGPEVDGLLGECQEGMVAFVGKAFVKR